MPALSGASDPSEGDAGQQYGEAVTRGARIDELSNLAAKGRTTCIPLSYRTDGC
jgi:hypothetical protein